MAAGLQTEVLKAVSRSFYLSLRLLPGPMRRPASTAYLLARISDTVADSASAGAEDRLSLLEIFSKQVRGDEPAVGFPESLVGGVSDAGEKLLLRRSVEVVRELEGFSEREKEIVREVIGTIVGGQKLDLERFGEADEENIICLVDGEALEDYAWRVAGCVGLFWTKLGYVTVGERFSVHPQEELCGPAVAYGKGLQLVNILRDLPKDLRVGRCYLPVEDPHDREALMAEFSKWREIAEEMVAEGPGYSRKLAVGRLRVASALPAMLAEETLRMMKGASFARLAERVKVPRRKVYRMFFRAWFQF